MTDEKAPHQVATLGRRGDVMHALTCPIRRRYLRWRWSMPFWRDDKTAQMLGVSQYGCHRCGRGMEAERDAAFPPGSEVAE